ncbi:MAG TPA: FkbM family methyltransferase [Gammaproteobacteria bacterium]
MNHQLLYAARKITKVAYRIQGIGLGRVCETIRSRVAKRWDGGRLEIDDFMGSLKFSCDLGEHMGSQIFWRGHYSGDQLELIGKYLPRGGVFLDVGANQGEFTVYAASLVGEQGRVVAFEPLRRNVECLEANVRLNGYECVTVVEQAVGAEPGEAPMFTSYEPFADGTEHKGGLATLFDSDMRNTVVEKVAVGRIDDTVRSLGLSRVDVIKLDIEGGELPALNGAEDTVRRFRPVLILEIGEEMCRAAGYAPQELIDWLHERGYRLELILYGGRTRPLVPPIELGAYQNVVALPGPSGRHAA